MATYTDEHLDTYNAEFSQHVVSAAYLYKSDLPEGIHIGLTAGVVDPKLIKTTAKVAEVTGHIGYRKVTEGELSIEHLVAMTEELIKDIKNQPTSLLSAEKLKEHTIHTGIVAGNIIALYLLGHIPNDQHNGYAYEVDTKDAKPLR